MRLLSLQINLLKEIIVHLTGTQDRLYNASLWNQENEKVFSKQHNKTKIAEI